MSTEKLDLARLRRDVVAAANLADVQHDESRIQRVLEVFSEGFGSAAVELRTTTRPREERTLSYRYIELGHPPDPSRMAVDAGLLQPGGRPVDRLIGELQGKLAIQGYGVDAEASYGLEKIWPFFTVNYPMDHVLELEELPDAFRDNPRYFDRYGLTHFSIVAADYRHETANLYFLVQKPGQYTPQTIASMIRDAGGEVPPPHVLDYIANMVAINVTCSWRSEEIERVCFYVPTVQPPFVPAWEHPLLARMVNETPIVAAHRAFIVGWAFGRTGSYTKLEIDYTGTTMEAFHRWTTIPEGPPSSRGGRQELQGLPRPADLHG